MYHTGSLGCMPPEQLGGLFSGVKKALKKIEKPLRPLVKVAAVGATAFYAPALLPLVAGKVLAPKPSGPGVPEQAPPSIEMQTPGQMQAAQAAAQYTQQIAPTAPTMVDRFVKSAPGPADPTKKLMLYGAAAVALVMGAALLMRRR